VVGDTVHLASIVDSVNNDTQFLCLVETVLIFTKLLLFGITVVTCLYHNYTSYSHIHNLMLGFISAHVVNFV